MKTPADTVRVAHILGALDRGGVEMRTLDLVRSLDDAFSIYMITLSGREGSLAKDYRDAGASVKPIAIYSWTFPFRFLYFLYRHRIQAVHSHIHHTSGLITFLAMLAGVQKRVVHYRSDGVVDSSLSFLDRLKNRIMRGLIDISATRIVAVSPATMAIAWKEEWSTDPRCSVLVNGFDLASFEDRINAGGCPDLGKMPRPIILHLGRADLPTKNRLGAIDVFNRYCERGNVGTLVFVGRDGIDEDQAELNRAIWKTRTDSARTSERVLFLGECSNIIDILYSVDVLLFTSLLEGLPGVLVESRCAGVPVVASDLPGCRFLAETLTRVNLVSTADSLDTWVDALEEELREPLQLEERQAALESLRGSDFDLNKANRRYIELWTT